MELSDRESYQGQFGNKTFTCLAEGYPEPSLYWSYNGDSVIGINGVIARGTELIVSSPQAYHSGIYQCLVWNIIGENIFIDQRAWFLEVRMPSKKKTNALLLSYCCLYLYMYVIIQFFFIRTHIY